jgi:hypothetical protein
MTQTDAGRAPVADDGVGQAHGGTPSRVQIAEVPMARRPPRHERGDVVVEPAEHFLARVNDAADMLGCSVKTMYNKLVRFAQATNGR